MKIYLAILILIIIPIAEARITGCDLFAEDIAVSYACSTNQSIPCAYAVYGKIKNIGNEMCPSTTMYMQIKNKSITRTFNLNILALPPSASMFVTMPYERDLNTTYSVYIFADNEDLIYEPNERNNKRYEERVNVSIRRYI